jgi:hypothetical protein
LMNFCARATRDLRRPSLNTRSGRPSSLPTREKIAKERFPVLYSVVTDPGRSRIVAGTFVAEKDVCGVELVPLEMRTGITRRVVDQRPSLAGN